MTVEGAMAWEWVFMECDKGGAGVSEPDTLCACMDDIIIKEYTKDIQATRLRT